MDILSEVVISFPSRNHVQQKANHTLNGRNLFPNGIGLPALESHSSTPILFLNRNVDQIISQMCDVKSCHTIMSPSLVETLFETPVLEP